MAKNYADVYNQVGESSAVVQRFFLKVESSRGTLSAPTGADFFYTLDGGNIEFDQPFESSPHRTGRHHTSIVRKKKTQSWSLSTYFNIDQTLGAGGAAEIDPAMRTLWKSLLGKETVSSGLIYDSGTVPDLTFSLFECADRFARQGRGCFVQGGNIQLPGDGEAMIEWSGNGKDAIYLGIGKSVTDNDAGNTVTIDVADTDEFGPDSVGGMVMIIESNGTTRSADTPDGAPRIITAVAGNVITLNGAVLADADGSGIGAPIYLVYYEPTTPVAINDPVTGLIGTLSIVGMGGNCFRNFGLNIQNNHELRNNCYGSDSLDGTLFTAGARVTATVTMELGINKETFRFFKRAASFDGQNITAVLGSSTGRRFELEIPNAVFSVPSFSLPTEGSIPVSFEGTALQSALDAADEVTASFK